MFTPKPETVIEGLYGNFENYELISVSTNHVYRNEKERCLVRVGYKPQVKTHHTRAIEKLFKQGAHVIPPIGHEKWVGSAIASKWVLGTPLDTSVMGIATLEMLRHRLQLINNLEEAGNRLPVGDWAGLGVRTVEVKTAYSLLEEYHGDGLSEIEDKELRDRLIEMAREVDGESKKRGSNAVEGKPVLVHSDVHSGNLIWHLDRWNLTDCDKLHLGENEYDYGKQVFICNHFAPAGEREMQLEEIRLFLQGKNKDWEKVLKYGKLRKITAIGHLIWATRQREKEGNHRLVEKGRKEINQRLGNPNHIWKPVK